MSEKLIHQCIFLIAKGETFVCRICGAIHKCGPDNCDSLAFNPDHTQVCRKTGLCFGQRRCETFSDPSRNSEEPFYSKRVKRDQQIKNKQLDYGLVTKIVDCAIAIVVLSDEEKFELVRQILCLWDTFVAVVEKKRRYVHRRDRRCFIVSIMLSLSSGMKMNTGQYIVFPHPSIRIKKLNKKSRYSEFCVNDIRHGSNLIKDVFSNYILESHLAINLSGIYK